MNSYDVEYAYNGSDALKLIHSPGKKYDAVLLDTMLPIMSGHELCERIRQVYNSNQLPILFITVKNTPADIVRGLKAGANDYLTKPISKTELLARLHTHLALKGLNNEIEETQREFILRVGTIAETRSRETGNHVKRVAKYSAILARKCNLSNEEVTLLEFASPMHDIGKVGIPDAILNKPAKLTPEEFEIMKKHTEIGYEMIGLSDKKLLQTAGIIALTHHEQWSGNGYPKGLKQNEIPIFGRITAVADVFDAVGSDRCYKKAWHLDKILEHFKNERGKLFDPDLIDIFFKNLSLFLSIKKKYEDP
jgi:putative two-component system response regulator